MAVGREKGSYICQRLYIARVVWNRHDTIRHSQHFHKNRHRHPKTAVRRGIILHFAFDDPPTIQKPIVPNAVHACNLLHAYSIQMRNPSAYDQSWVYFSEQSPLPMTF